jgi:hypothetical protein
MAVVETDAVTARRRAIAVDDDDDDIDKDDIQRRVAHLVINMVFSLLWNVQERERKR